MDQNRIIMSVLWICLMFVYLLGDVLRIFSGDFTPGEMGGQKATKWLWLAAAAFMLIPILMALMSLFLPYPAIRWVTIVVAALMFLFNAVGLPSYPSLYDKFLIIVGLVLNLATIFYAVKWVV